jgi:hypothetical protein
MLVAESTAPVRCSQRLSGPAWYSKCRGYDVAGSVRACGVVAQCFRCPISGEDGEAALALAAQRTWQPVGGAVREFADGGLPGLGFGVVTCIVVAGGGRVERGDTEFPGAGQVVEMAMAAEVGIGRPSGRA